MNDALFDCGISEEICLLLCPYQVPFYYDCESSGGMDHLGSVKMREIYEARRLSRYRLVEDQAGLLRISQKVLSAHAFCPRRVRTFGQSDCEAA
jgi:hypothetical protein